MIILWNVIVWSAVIYLMVGIPYVAWLWFTDVPEKRYELPVISDEQLERSVRRVVMAETVKSLAIAVATWPWIVMGRYEDARLRRFGKQVGGRHS